MEYSIKITSDASEQAKSLLQFLKMLTASRDYLFLEIEECPSHGISKEMQDELDARYKHFEENKQSYVDWETIKQNYVSK